MGCKVERNEASWDLLRSEGHGLIDVISLLTLSLYLTWPPRFMLLSNTLLH